MTTAPSSPDKGKPLVRAGRKATGLPSRSQPGYRSRPSAMSGPLALLVMAIRIAPVAAALALAACGSGVHATIAGACDRVAARDGSDRAAGTLDAPFHTVQKLADALQPGQTGCLR